MVNQKTENFLTDLFDRRTATGGENQTIWFQELKGGTIIEPMAFAPDPNSHRYDYYYNSISNCLYKKMNNKSPKLSYWLKVSE